MTRMLAERDRERNLMIKDYLNRTFDDIKLASTTPQLQVSDLRRGSDNPMNLYIRHRPIEDLVKAPQACSDEYQIAVTAVSSELKTRYKDFPLRP